MANKPDGKDPDPKKRPTLSWLDYVRKTDNELLKICRVDTFRGSGRGGQKRNKTTNAVRLTLFKIAVTESASRSKAQNVTSALNKLRLAIALKTAPEFRRGEDAGIFPEEIQPYLFRDIIRIRPQNPVFPIFIGCLLDHFIIHEGAWKLVAAQFGVSSSQLRRFVEKHPHIGMALKSTRKRQTEDITGVQELNGEEAP